MCTRVPACPVEDEHDLLGRSSADLTRERLQLNLEERDGHAGGQVEDRAAGGGMHKTNQVAPVIAVLDRRRWALPVEAPDFVQNGFQADAMLVDGPEFDARLRIRGGDCLDDRTDLFLNATCCSGSARTCRGRGLRRLPSRRTR